MNRFPLTALQKAYAVGRRVNGDRAQIREKECYELQCTGFDAVQFAAAVQAVYSAHPMLGAVCTPEQNWEMQPRKVSAVRVTEAADASERARTAAEQKAAFFAEEPYQPDAPPVTFSVICDAQHNATILTHTDGLYFDGESQGILLCDLETAYCGGKLPADAGFAAYEDAWAPFAAENRADADAYWQAHAADLPDAPVLPHDPSSPAGTYYVTVRRLPAEFAARCAEIAKNARLTPFSILLALYCKALGRYAESKDFALNLPVSHRPMWDDRTQNLLGLFADFTVIGYTHQPEQTVRELAGQLRKTLNICMEQAPYSGTEILRHASRVRGENVQVPYTFTSLLEMPQHGGKVFQKTDFRALTGGLHLETIVQPVSDGILLTLTGDAGYVSQDAAEGIAEMFAQACTQLMQDDALLGQTALALPAKDAAVIRQANDVPVHDVPQSVAELLQSSLEQSGDAVAAVQGKPYTCRELMQAAGAVQREIRRVSPAGGRVGLLLRKGIRQLIAELACAGGGTVFFPIETEQPPESIAYCLTHAEISVLVTEQAFAEILPQLPVQSTVLMEDAERSGGAEMTFRARKPGDDAFLIHTSGSTGRPKSIVLRQAGFVNCLLHTAELFDITGEDTCLAVTNYCHDMSLFDMIFMPAYGGKVVMPDVTAEKDPHKWIAMMLENRVTVWNSVPAFMEMLLASEDDDLAKAIGQLRRIMLGGDWIRPAMLAQIRAMNPDVRIFSVGGPSETTVWNIYHEVTAEDLAGSFIPYGKPFPNTAYHILDGDLLPCPVGVRGGMYVAGKGVAREYAGLPEETASRFVTVRGERMYRTGDLGMYLPDGSIRILGREDFQVKINGKRIELAGIETALKQVSGVQICAVVQNADSRALAAYYTADRDIPEQELQAALRAALPSYMIPQHLIRLAEMPLTRNAKPDRKKLAALPVQRKEPAAAVQFDSAVKQKLYEMCCTILEDSNLSPDDNFYYMGGDSISAMKLTAAIRKEFGVTPEVYDILNHPTLDEWTAMIAEAKAQLSEESGETEMQLLDICRMLFPDAELSMADSLFSVSGNERSARMLASAIRSGFRAEISQYEILSRPFFRDWAAMIKERTSV